MAVEIAHRLRGLASIEEERLIVIAKDLDSIVEPWRNCGVRLEDLGAEHLPELAALNRERGESKLDRRFAEYVDQGFHGFVARRGEELVGYYWWVDRDVHTLFPDLRKLMRRIALGDGDVYGSDCSLLEERHGGRLAADFLFKVESVLRDRGYRRLWGHIVSDNRRARWIYSTRGYVPMWMVTRRRFVMLQRLETTME
jgi:Acetyltransferase (GNAT) family